MKRVRPDRVVKAFKRTGLRPAIGVMRGFTVDGEFSGKLYPSGKLIPCACGLGVLLPERVRKSVYELKYAARKLHLPRSYVEGFTQGFDGCNPYEWTFRNEEAEYRYCVGYYDGVEAHREVLKAVGDLRE